MTSVGGQRPEPCAAHGNGKTYGTPVRPFCWSLLPDSGLSRAARVEGQQQQSSRRQPWRPDAGSSCQTLVSLVLPEWRGNSSSPAEGNHGAQVSVAGTVHAAASAEAGGLAYAYRSPAGAPRDRGRGDGTDCDHHRAGGQHAHISGGCAQGRATKEALAAHLGLLV